MHCGYGDQDSFKRGAIASLFFPNNHADETVWPKLLPPLTAEQQRIADDFMEHWHTVLPARYGIVERFNHGYIRAYPHVFDYTLEIGAGRGAHRQYELPLLPGCRYLSTDIRPNMLRHAKGETLVADGQQRMPYPDGTFDRIIAIHVLEHLPNLPACIAEMRRLIDAKNGVFFVVIPCEGGLAYALARRISAQRVFEKRYKMPYKWLIEREHINRPHEIVTELERHFIINDRVFFPFVFMPFVFCNLTIGLTLRCR